jgi:alkylhydroperoxidase family enzyme
MTQNDFPVFDETSAPAQARPILAAVKAQFGFVPNLVGVLAASPAAVEAYASLVRIFGSSSLTTTEQHIVLQTVNLFHKCHYCVPAHSTVAALTGVAPAVDRALRAGEPLGDDRLEALRRFARALIESRGEPPASERAAFLRCYAPSQMLEVIVGVALKTISNYTNHLARTPLDAAFAKAQ